MVSFHSGEVKVLPYFTVILGSVRSLQGSMLSTAVYYIPVLDLKSISVYNVRVKVLLSSICS